MGKFKIGLAVALATFIIGVVVASLWVIQNRHPPEPLPAVPVVAIRQTPHHPTDWKKVDVDGKLSFYLPPDMEQGKDSVGNIEYFGPHKFFGSKTLNIGYTYVEKRYNEELWRGKVTCELLAKEPEGVSNVQSSEVEIDGLRSRQIFWQSDRLGLSVMTVCFPDVGAGTVLTLGAFSKDEQALDVAKQVFSSIEFP